MNTHIYNKIYQKLQDISPILETKQKSLFIIGQAKSATTSLQKTCCKILDFRNGGEHLNNRLIRRNFPDLNITNFKLWAPKEQWPLFRAISKIFQYGWVIKDVSQQPFIFHNIEWINSNFNVLYIERPIHEVVFTNRRKKWRWKHLIKMRTLLNKIKFQHKITYEDYIYDHTVILNILHGMYTCCKEYNYIDSKFISKRKEVTSRKIDTHYLGNFE